MMVARTKAGTIRKYRVPKAFAYPSMVTDGFDSPEAVADGSLRMLISTHGLAHMAVLMPTGTAIAKTQRAVVMLIVLREAEDNCSANHPALSAESTAQ